MILVLSKIIRAFQDNLLRCERRWPQCVHNRRGLETNSRSVPGRRTIMHTLTVQDSSRRTSCLCRHCLLRTFTDAIRRLYLSYHAARCIRGLPPEPEIPREVRYMLLRPLCQVKKLQLDTTMTHMLSFTLCPEDDPRGGNIAEALQDLTTIPRTI